MTDLNALTLFARVATAASFSDASRRLKIPVTTVSRRIAELEAELGVRLLERSTRKLRLTEVGTEILEYAQRGIELGDSVDDLVSSRLARLSGTLRISSPPSIADSILVPIVRAFQATHPGVNVRVLISERFQDPIAEQLDVMFRFGPLRDSTLVARRILRYRHQLVASPAYLKKHGSPATPAELLQHPLLAFSYWRSGTAWKLVSRTGKETTLDIEPRLAMNDFTGLAAALASGAGIGDLPPVVQPELLRSGALVEVLPKWRFRASELSLVHLGGRQPSRRIRAFKDVVADMAPKLFSNLPV